MRLMNCRLRVDGHLTVLDEDGHPIPDVYAIGDNAMPLSGRLPATAQGRVTYKTGTQTLTPHATGSRLSDGQIHGEKLEYGGQRRVCVLDGRHGRL